MMRVIFRINKKDGKVFAVFPEHLADLSTAELLPPAEVADHLQAYSTELGYHPVSYGHTLTHSKRATPEQYAPLLAELEELGNDLRIVLARSNAVYCHCLVLAGADLRGRQF